MNVRGRGSRPCLGSLKRDEIKFLEKAAPELSLEEGGGRERLSLQGGQSRNLRELAPAGNTGFVREGGNPSVAVG